MRARLSGTTAHELVPAAYGPTLLSPEDNVMIRSWLLAAAAIAATPVLTTAQSFPHNTGDYRWGPRVRITPYVGISPGFGSGGPAIIRTNNTIVAELDDFDFDFEGGPVAGLNIEVRVAGRYGIAGALGVSVRDETVFRADDIFDNDRVVAGGGTLIFAKLVGQMRFRQEHPWWHLWRVNSALFLGPALVRDYPEDNLIGPDDDDARTAFAINFGGEGELPLNDGSWSITAALEDYVMFWNDDALERRLLSPVRREFGPGSLVSVDGDISNLVVLRFGMSYRFGSAGRKPGFKPHRGLRGS